MGLSWGADHGTQQPRSVSAEQMLGCVKGTVDRWGDLRTIGRLASCRSCIEDGPKNVPKSGQLGLDESEDVALSGNDPCVEAGFILDEKGFHVRFV